MSQDESLGSTLDVLRANLRAAGIHASTADFEGIVARGFMSRVATFEQVVDTVLADQLPAYLEVPPVPTPAPASQAALQPSEHPAHTITATTEPLAGATIGQLAPLLRTRQLSPVELAEAALAAAQQADGVLNAFQLLLAEPALAAAQQAEREIAAGEYRGALHGVPLAIKDLLAFAGTPTTAGSRILADWVPPSSATAAERLVAAGAVIIGKTRLSEFAYSPGSNNGHYGPTRNPWNRAYDAGGSSSGSAAVVAAGVVPAAIGSDTGGSIRLPAAQCGIVGLKPTFGRVSLAGVVPLSFSLDHLGPLTRSVADAALLLAALAGHDLRDGRTQPGSEFTLPPDLEAGVARLRIGVLRDAGWAGELASGEVLAAWQAGLACLQAAGAELVELDLPEFDTLWLLNGALLALEAQAYHLGWLRSRLDQYSEFMRQRILASFSYRPGALVRCQQARASLRRRCQAIFERVDLLSTPMLPGMTPELGVPASTQFSGPFNLLGWPALSLPAGRGAASLPLGMQLVGAPWAEATIFRTARVIELARPWALHTAA